MTSATHASGSLFDWSLTRSRPSSAGWPKVAAVAGAVVLTAAAAQCTLPLPFTSVPFVLTPLAVLLTGAALGPRLGASAQIVYLVLGAIGLPVFAPSLTLPPGLLRLAGPTGGFLMAYPAAAFAAGWLAARGWDRRYVTSALAMTAGLAVIFAGGAAWFMVASHATLASALNLAVWPFLPFDLVKVLVAAVILPQTWRFISPRG
jgi:biotin transport system substrate-specific component